MVLYAASNAPNGSKISIIKPLGFVKTHDVITTWSAPYVWHPAL